MPADPIDPLEDTFRAIVSTRATIEQYNSPEYQKILPGRLDNSTARSFIVEGVS